VTSGDSAVNRLLGGEDGRSPRVDAQRNVVRLVAAARAAIDEVGLDVTAHEIARRAGVGIGTFYRRIPSREALLEAVLQELLDDAVALADHALRDEDPWHGFGKFASAFVRLRAASCGVNDALGGVRGLELDLSLAQLRDRIQRLVERAKAAGTMRPDVDWQDVSFLLAGAITQDHTIGLKADDEQWRRNLRIILDGLRTQLPSPPTAVPLAEVPLAYTIS
jgi:AcrR family transcriptional regulator